MCQYTNRFKISLFVVTKAYLGRHKVDAMVFNILYGFVIFVTKTTLALGQTNKLMCITVILLSDLCQVISSYQKLDIA